MFSAEELFLKDYSKLQAILKNPTEMELLEASAILRRLLMDGRRLMDQANENYRLNIKFMVIPPLLAGVESRGF